MRAYCYADGRILFGGTLPKGALPIAKGRASTLRRTVSGLARRGHEAGVLFVPGIPEAANQLVALAALESFTAQLAKSGAYCKGIEVFTRSHRWPIQGRGTAG